MKITASWMHPSLCLVKLLHVSITDLQIIFRSVCREDSRHWISKILNNSPTQLLGRFRDTRTGKPGDVEKGHCREQ